MNKAVAALAVIVILVVGGFALANKDDNKNNIPATNTSASSSNQGQNTPADNTNTGQNSSNQTEGTIIYNSNGFSPSSLTVKAGATITVKNTSSSPLDFESDPHPQHTDNTDLNIGTVAPGSSKTFTTSEKGTWGYHNHLDPSDTGKIVVQ